MKNLFLILIVVLFASCVEAWGETQVFFINNTSDTITTHVDYEYSGGYTQTIYPSDTGVYPTVRSFSTSSVSLWNQCYYVKIYRYPFTVIMTGSINQFKYKAQ